MRVTALAFVLTGAAAPAIVQGFTSLNRNSNKLSRSSVSSPSARTATGTNTAPFRAEKVVNGVIFSGDPPEAAYAMNHYDILLQHSIQAPGSGDVVSFSDILKSDDSSAANDQSHIVVFLRSLG